MDRMNRLVQLDGARGKARLCLAAGKSERMIDRYRSGLSEPPTSVMVQLALACEFTEEEALAMADAGSSEAAKETA
jgi:hypothetical protein